MTSPAEFNLFLLLDLAPEVAWSAADFDSRLKEKRSEWIKHLNNPRRSLAARRNLELLPKLTEVAGSDAARMEHAEAAKSLRDSKLAERHLRLDQVIELLQVKGEIHRREVKELAKRFADVCTEAQIIGRLTVPVIEEPPAAPAAPAAKDLLDRSIANEIAQKLQELGHESLYDFLGAGFGIDTPNLVLRDKAEELYSSATKNWNKDIRLALTQTLAGHARNQFKTAESKKRYDDTLADMAFDGLRGLIAEIVGISGTGSIERSQVDVLVARFSKEVMARPGEVRRVISEFVQFNRWFIAETVEPSERR